MKRGWLVWFKLFKFARLFRAAPVGSAVARFGRRGCVARLFGGTHSQRLSVRSFSSTMAAHNPNPATLTKWLARNLTPVLKSWKAVWAKQPPAEREKRGMVCAIAEGPAQTFFVPQDEVVAMAGSDGEHVLREVASYNPKTHMVLCLVEAGGALACAVVPLA